MRLTRLPILLLILVGLVAAGCADDAELGGPTVGGALAASVGSFQYTTDDLQAEVEAWAANPGFLQQVLQITDTGVPGRRSADFVAFVLSHRVLSEQSRQMAIESSGYQPSTDDVDALLAQIDDAFPDASTGGPLFQAYSEDFRRSLGVDFAYQQNLANIDPTTTDPPEVVVNPRYGSFEDQDRGIGRVTPPGGPRPLPFDFGL